jgi:hypothetical protein
MDEASDDHWVKESADGNTLFFSDSQPKGGFYFCVGVTGSCKRIYF